MNLAKNKTLVGVVVGIMIVGVAMTYVPLLFAPQAPQGTNNTPTPDQTANLPSALQATTTTSTPNSLPSGFSGLDKENQQLNNLNNQLNQGQ